MSISAEVICESELWNDVPLASLADQAGAAVSKILGHEGAFEFALLGCDDARIAKLNADFRGKPQPTNVLSWPSEELSPGALPNFPELGDVALAFETIKAEATQAQIPFDRHLLHLITHGILHLLGYDHQNDEEAAQMEGLEVQILASLGIPNPYIRQPNETRQ